jgi:hypothetical protein
MSSVITSPPRVNANRPRKTYPPSDARGRLDAGADRHADIIAGVAILTISRGDATDVDSALYWVKALVSGGRVVGFDLRKFGTGVEHRVTVCPDTGAWGCDCADAIFRDRVCKHQSAMLTALPLFVEHAA